MNDGPDARDARPSWAWLLLIIAASFALRAAHAATHGAPWILMDELVHAEIAESIAHGGPIGARGEPFPHRALVYPALIAPAFRIESAPVAYLVAKLLNALMISLVAIPVFLLARRLVDRRRALVATALALAIPSTAYASTLMAENAFYPLAMTGLLLTVRAIERPTVLRQLTAWALGLVALLTHAQGVALLGAMFAALVCAAGARVGGFEAGHTASRLRTLLPSVAVVGALVAGAVTIALTGHWNDLFGHYSRLVDRPVGGDELVLAAKNSLREVAMLAWTTGILPAAALAALFVRTVRRGTVAAAPVVLVFGWAIVLAVGSSSLWTARLGGEWILERTTFWVAPAFVIALVWWSAAGATAGRRSAVTIMAVILGALLPAWQLTRAVEPTYNNLGAAALAQMQAATGIAPLWAAGIGAVGIATILLVPRLARLAPLITALLLVAFHVVTEHRTAGFARDTLWHGIQTRVDWIDRAVPPDAEVVAVWTGTTGGQTVWLNEFFNRRVTRVCSLDTALADDFLKTPLRIADDGRYIDGNGSPITARWVLIASTHPIAGERIATDPGAGMDLYRVDGPLRARRAP